MYIRASQVAQWWSICLQGKKRCSFIPGWRRSPSIGNGNALQCSCLEHSMDRGSWWATVHGVAKSQTRLSDWTTYTCRSQSPNSSHPSVLTPAAMQPSKTEPGGNRKYKQIITSNRWIHSESAGCPSKLNIVRLLISHHLSSLELSVYTDVFHLSNNKNYKLKFWHDLLYAICVKQRFINIWMWVCKYMHLFLQRKL